MSSYQDIDSRLRTVEDQLNFAMSAIRMKAGMTTGLVGADGKPQVKVIEGSLLDLYKLSRQVTTVVEAPSEPQV